jgi:hypothetical protein
MLINSTPVLYFYMCVMYTHKYSKLIGAISSPSAESKRVPQFLRADAKLVKPLNRS